VLFLFQNLTATGSRLAQRLIYQPVPGIREKGETDFRDKVKNGQPDIVLNVKPSQPTTGLR